MIKTSSIIIAFLITVLFASCERDYTVSELQEEFAKEKEDIYSLKAYFNDIVPVDYYVEIEFGSDNKIYRFGVQEKYQLVLGEDFSFLDWDLDINGSSVDSVIKRLGWTTDTLYELKKRLKQANCIGIAGREPVKISFKRCGFGQYSFIVFDTPIPDSGKDRYNDSCINIYINEKLVLHFEGGAIGAQCFYNF